MWFLSFLPLFIIQYQNVVSKPSLTVFWKEKFVSLNLADQLSSNGLLASFVAIFNNVGGLFIFSSLFAVIFLFGIFKYYRTDKTKVIILTVPIISILAASSFELYPITERLLLFFVPFAILGFYGGILYLCKDYFKKNIFILLIIFLSIIIITPSFSYLITSTANPLINEDIRGTMQYISNNGAEGDLIFVYSMAYPAFQYYETKYDMDKFEIIEGESACENWNNFTMEIDSIPKDSDTWLIFTRILSESNTKKLISYLDDYYSSTEIIVIDQYITIKYIIDK